MPLKDKWEGSHSTKLCHTFSFFSYFIHFIKAQVCSYTVNFLSQNGDPSVLFLVCSVSADQTETGMDQQIVCHQTCQQDLHALVKELAILKEQIQVVQEENQGTALCQVVAEVTAPKNL